MTPAPAPLGAAAKLGDRRALCCISSANDGRLRLPSSEGAMIQGIMPAAKAHQRRELLGMCDRLGYPEAMRQEGFPLWHGDQSAEIACFAVRERMDMSTVTMVAGAAAGDRERSLHFDAARALAAPICILRSAERWDVYSVRVDDRPALLSSGPPPDQDPVLARFLAPAALLAAKREPQQLSMLEIDVGLLASARGAAAREIDRRVRVAVARLLGEAEDRDSAETAARLVVRALTALAIRDKLTADRSLTTAIARVQELSPNYLQGSGSVERLIAIAEQLGDGLNFRTLDPALLGDVYERAVLLPAKRLAIGAYYTPPEIGRRMLDQLPLEEVPPERRRFLDPSCGSGTLLLAANDRLMSALPEEIADHRRHSYALERLVGSDNDPFAVEIARLALLLQALPYGNGYRVEQADALAPEQSAERAPFVVSNPPWGYERREGKRVQRAEEFLRRLVARTDPQGFMACVLPVSWLTDDTSRESRAWLRRSADVFEVWRLPTRSFRESTMAPCVVFAQVARPSTQGYRFLNVWAKGRRRFLSEGEADEVVLAAAGSGPDPLSAPWIEGLPELAGAARLGEVATIRNGAPLQSIEKLTAGGPHLLLRRYGDVPPFGSVTPEVADPCLYPDDFSKRGRHSDPKLYLRPKVLVPAMTSVDVPWRLRAFLDPIGVVPRNSMYAIVPKQEEEEDPEEALMALLGFLASAIASLWVAQHTATRMVNARTLASLPVPPREHWSSLAQRAREVLRAQQAGQALDPTVRALDRAVFAAFGFSAESTELVAEALAGQRAPERVVRFDPAPPAEAAAAQPRILRAGTTVARTDGAVKMQVPGLTPGEGVWLANPPHLPGWLAREGADFEVLAADGHLRDASFRFQPDAWIGLEQLLADFE